jgi:hypothetical protein
MISANYDGASRRPRSLGLRWVVRIQHECGPWLAEHSVRKSESSSALPFRNATEGKDAIRKLGLLFELSGSSGLEAIEGVAISLLSL